MQEAKDDYKQHLQMTRSLLGPFFRAAGGVGVSKEWSAVLADMEEGPEIRGMISSVLIQTGLVRRIPDQLSLADIPYRALSGTACWAQYHIALSFLAAHKSGWLAKPDSGDQVDVRQACYAGMSDVFVTGDARMLEVLETMVPSCSARVVSAAQFIAEAAA